MKVKMIGTIIGNHRGFAFEVPDGTICEVSEIIENVVYFHWEDEIATVYKHMVELID